MHAQGASQFRLCQTQLQPQPLYLCFCHVRTLTKKKDCVNVK